jgi:hypothetical protein
MSVEDNKAVVVRGFTDFWGSDFDASIVDELAAPDIRFQYSLHNPLRGRDEVREFAHSGRTMEFTGTTVIKVVDGMIAEELGLDDGVTVLTQLGLIGQQ